MLRQRTLHSIRQIGLSAALLCAAVLAAHAEPTTPATQPAQRVELKTSDGLKIVASYFAPKPTDNKTKAAAAILVHIYPSDRHSWDPLVPHLLDAGFAVLTYDIRGTGDSVQSDRPEVRKQYAARDPKLFADAWRDADAAVKWLLKQQHVDATRVAMIGASIGSSISLDFAGRCPFVRAVVCLSPGVKYFGQDSLAAIRKCDWRPVLLCAPEAEREASEALAKAGKHVTVDIRPGDASRHGTHMFEADYAAALEARIAAFAKGPTTRLRSADPMP